MPYKKAEAVGEKKTNGNMQISIPDIQDKNSTGKGKSMTVLVDSMQNI